MKLSWAKAVSMWNKMQPWQDDLYGIPKKGGDYYDDIRELMGKPVEKKKEAVQKETEIVTPPIPKTEGGGPKIEQPEKPTEKPVEKKLKVTETELIKAMKELEQMEQANSSSGGNVNNWVLGETDERIDKEYKKLKERIASNLTEKGQKNTKTF